VDIGGAIQMKELPLVVGIMADLAGQPAEPPPPLKERRFVDIDRDNFNDILAAIAPRLTCRVDNTLRNDNTKLNVELHFHHMDDFHPLQVLKQVQPLTRLFEARQRLRDLLAKLDGNDQLDALLQSVLASTERLQALKTETGGK
jgi:type VI secretion system protein ImpB